MMPSLSPHRGMPHILALAVFILMLLPARLCFPGEPASTRFDVVLTPEKDGPAGKSEQTAAMQFDEIVVTAQRSQEPGIEEFVPLDAHQRRIDTNDRARGGSTADLLGDLPGVALRSNGAVATTPVLHGLDDDRVKVLVNGMAISSACPNHMNSSLSYIHPSDVSQLRVVAGITPVSMGGDSIGGTVSVESSPPVFAGPDEKVHAAGELSTFFNSNNSRHGGSIAASAANGNVSLGYIGSLDKAGNYHDGSGNAVTSTYYETNKHTVTLGAQGGGNLFVIQAGQQTRPEEGFVNQQMDMTRNFGEFLNARYIREFGWGMLDARIYWQEIDHEMNLGMDKVNLKGAMFMPMDTSGKDSGYSLKAEIPFAREHTLRLGNEFHRFELDDWWPPVPDQDPWMGPDTFINISNGRRDRLGTFAEWDARWTPAWTTLLGLRNDTVWTDTDTVQGYSDGMMYAPDAAKFNAQDHRQTDVNYDLTALISYEPNEHGTYEAGYARKTRSPNLYERYAWSTNWMASGMINWFGDGNYYVGAPDLKPEVAHTVSATADWHDSARKNWGLKVTPYYTYVQDYIGVNEIEKAIFGESTFSKLRFANHDARIYGADLSWNVGIWDNPSLGRGQLKGVIGWVHGETVDTGNSLYHIMPINALIRMEQTLAAWKNVVELQLVDRKTAVDALRHEPETPEYALVNLRTSYEWWKLLFDVGITNLFDKTYYLPLGGVNFDDFLATGWNGKITPLTGPGRSFYAGLTIKY